MAQRPRSAGVVYAVVSLVLLVLLGVMTLTLRTPPPPTIAEFAPQAIENISESPDDLGTRSGAGAGGVPTPTPTPPDAAAEGAIEVPRVRRCVGDPPRQIEDPQSPPCVPYWAGDNGGSTSKGVTRSEVVLAMPDTGIDTGSIGNLRSIVSFFNRRFEFYGRTITFKPFASRWGVFGGDPAALTADAVDADEQQKAFASLGFLGGNEFKNNYYTELAKRRIVAIDSEPTPMLNEYYQRHDPYLWHVFPALDAWENAVGRWMCAALKDKRPEWAGPDVTATATSRRFGLIRGRTSNFDASFPATKPLIDAAANCGVRFEVVKDSFNDAQADANAMIAMKQAGVTSIVCVCDGGNLLLSLMPAASGQGYHPEWLIQSYHFQEREDTTQQFPHDQSRSAFGLTYLNKLNPPGDMPWWWALREVDPAANVEPQQRLFVYHRYMQLLMFASAVMHAGPRLTAETFGGALRRLQFPNPGCGGPPHYQACVGVATGSHSLVDDAAMIWWSQSERGHMGTQSNQPGTYCYVDQGRRVAREAWTPQSPAYFRGACR